MHSLLLKKEKRMVVVERTNKHRRTATLLSIIPVFGQFYNKQIVKGIIFLVFAIAFVIVSFDFVSVGIWGLVTLGTELPRDNSVFLLAEGIIAFIIMGFGVGFYLINLKDANENGKRRDNGEEPANIVKSYHNLLDAGYPYLISSPAFILLIFSVIFPLVFSALVAFTNYDLYHSAPANLADWVGLETFMKIFTVDIWRSTLFNVLGWTIIWTLVASTLQVAIGVFLAVLVHQRGVKFKKFIRTMLILPWAVPGFVTILIFGALFNDSFGAINNQLLAFLNVSPIPWLNDPLWTRIALIMIQSWLGFPYIFVVTTGVLQSIPDELYEAAVIDGAGSFQMFRRITFPLIMTAMSPIIITQYTMNFNNFNIIYLFNGGGPAVAGSTAGGTDIIVSWIYKLTTQNSQYALAAALTIFVSVIVVSIALWQFRRTKSFKETV